mmetsp:Transcript_12382/g.34103  ORF Transcript_12382/g.34103 Transcript_12382/m.34103 type:complete len:153 (-) Transcript_12382:746-1204(-)|eukprot:CAMPEP_0198119484 /NCGR_PEP_ID=MMETSP1442-20131203/25805_1 /TAXON_ID= /ORGANISM="Craspedostauros australis, Strain CCMP3328" /LENGTH=152 /DNA_ID=CAMNT_0043777967 /DNA_START=84 /DNA_END=542 /DNA_ORIENTATION=+
MSSHSSLEMKELRFADVTVQTYPIVLGDNPACSVGAPVQLSWDPVSTEVIDLEFYEFCRARERRSTCRALPAEKRGKLLLKAGYSMEEIASAALQVDAIRAQRAETLSSSQGWERLGSLLLKTGKLPRGILKGFVSAGKALVKPVQQVARSA